MEIFRRTENQLRGLTFQRFSAKAFRVCTFQNKAETSVAMRMVGHRDSRLIPRFSEIETSDLLAVDNDAVVAQMWRVGYDAAIVNE